MKPHPLVSVVMAAYNGEKYIAAQINSILEQDYPEIELVVSDDASTDCTADIVSKYTERDSRVRLINNKNNIGYVKNFEKCIDSSRGQYISFSDQDDLWFPEKLSSVLNLMRSVGAPIGFSDSAYCDESGDSLGGTLWSDLGVGKNELDLVDQGLGFKALLKRNFVQGATMIVTKDLLQHCVPFKAGFPHDYWIALISSIRGCKAASWRRPTMYYRIHPDQAIGVGNSGVAVQPLHKRLHHFSRVDRTDKVWRWETLNQHVELLRFNGGQIPTENYRALLKRVDFEKHRANLGKRGVLRWKKILRYTLRGNYGFGWKAFKSIIRDAICD